MRAYAVLAGLGLIAAAPAARAYEHVCPAPGTEIVTTQFRTPIRYEGQEGLACLRSQGGKPINNEIGHYRFYPRGGSSSELYGKYLAAAYQLWPLAPGKRTDFPYSAVGDGSSAGSTRNNHYYRAHLSVEAAREITVPAGRFEVVPIVLDIRGERGNYHHSRYTYFYAPALGTNVKFTYELVSGSSATGSTPWELVRYQAPGQPPIGTSPASGNGDGDQGDGG
jgi:hypothetical protein